MEKKIQIFRQINVKNFIADQYVTDQVFYESKDGTKIPMFIVRDKNLELNGKTPTILYGYGGFNIAMQPYFSVSRVMWVQHFGGIYAVANLRGGK